MSLLPCFKRGLALALFLALPAMALACSIPVFRYAIEHWRPDPYQVFVYHDQDLTEGDRQLLAWIGEQATAGANVAARTIDTRQSLEPVDQARWEKLGEATLPRLVVQMPQRVGDGEAPVNSAAWDEAELKRLISSPKRVELGERLIKGEVVWVFLESGNKEEDERVFALLSDQIAIQQESIELPEIEEQDLKDLSTAPTELEIRFSAMRVARDDPAEHWFKETLLSTEPDLRDEELADQPMVFPVFGRGRALYALVGQGINADMIAEAAVFLTGACQCTVKAENPGVDLLIPVRWDDFIEVSEPEEVDLPLVGLGGGLPLAKPAAEVPAPAAPAADIAAAPVATVAALLADAPTMPQAAAPSAVSAAPASDPASLGSAAAAADAEVASLMAEVKRTTAATDALIADAAAPAAPGVLLPVIVLLVMGLVVALLGTSVLRRS
jgi:hypothetical protein